MITQKVCYYIKHILVNARPFSPYLERVYMKTRALPSMWMTYCKIAYALTNSDNNIVTLVSLGKPRALTSTEVIIIYNISLLFLYINNLEISYYITIGITFFIYS